MTDSHKVIPIIPTQVRAPEYDASNGCAEAEPYALRVVGDSMAPEFLDGHVVIVDPIMEARAGAYVIVDHSGETLLRQIVDDAGRTFLQALNETYTRVPLEPNDRVRGVVVQRAGRQRKDRKHYYGD